MNGTNWFLRVVLGFALASLAFLGACSAGSSSGSEASSATAATQTKPKAGQAAAVFAGGCFWCMEPPFDELVGVVSTTSGYAGGRLPNPTYKQVTAGGSGHLEVVQVIYDPQQVTYAQLVDVFWRNVDPFDDGGQFCDRGASYKTAIFVSNASEQKVAEAAKSQLSGQFDLPIVTEILPLAADGFYPAEGYHQNYYQENPIRYKYYRNSCGRDKRLQQVWGDAAK